MSVEFTFGQVEAVVGAMNDISPEKRIPFASRLKHLMNPGQDKSGILDDERPRAEARPGRGKAAKFSFSQLMKIVIGVELLQAGIPPALAAKLVQGNWLQLRVGVYFGLYNEVERRAAGDPREETYWIMAPEALRDLSKSGESEWDHYEAFESVYRTEDLAGHLAHHSSSGFRGHYRRQLILNGTSITRAAAFIISFEMTLATLEELRDDLLHEIRDHQAKLEQALEEMDLKTDLANIRENKLQHPYFRDFEERMAARVVAVVDKLTEAQASILTSEEGSEVEIQSEDIIVLRKYDLIAVKQGEIVMTELGSYVADELRRKVKLADHLSNKAKRQLDTSIEAIGRMKETGLFGDSESKPTLGRSGKKAKPKRRSDNGNR